MDRPPFQDETVLADNGKEFERSRVCASRRATRKPVARPAEAVVGCAKHWPSAEDFVLKVWGRVNSINVQKVLWAIDELAVPFERVDAGMAFGVVGEPFYKKMNPNSRVPTIEDDGFVLWESNAIVRYLAGKHGAGKLYPTDPKVRADADRWMDWASNHINPAMTPVFWGLIRTPAEQRNAAQIKSGIEATAQVFQVLEQSLDGRSYVAGKDFTMGDIIVGVNTHRWYALPIERPKLARVEAYYERLKERAPFRKDVAQPLT
jgi:glutathione S-transferase